MLQLWANIIRHRFFGSTEALSWATACFMFMYCHREFVCFASLPPSWHHYFAMGAQFDLCLCGPAASVPLLALFWDTRQRPQQSVSSSQPSPLPPASSVSRAPCSHVASGYSGRLAGLSSLTSSKSYEIVHAVYGASSSEGGFSSLWHPLVVLATFMLFRRCLVLASVKLLLPLELPIIAASLWSSLGTFIISDL